MQHLFYIKENLGGSSEPVVAYSDFSADFFFKNIMTESAEELSFYISSENFKEWTLLLAKLHKHFRDIRIHLYTNTCLFEDVAVLLTKGMLYSCSFGVNDKKFLDLSKDEKKQKTLKRVFFRNGDFEYSNLENTDSQNNELLLVLMPAWNNFFPPFGIAHIAGAVDALDMVYDILDLNNLFYNSAKLSTVKYKKYDNLVYWQNQALYFESTSRNIRFVFDALLKKITPETKYIGFSIFGTTLLASEEAMQLVREKFPSVKIFCGGPHATETVVKDLIKRNLIDAAVMGEGEESTIELLTRWRNNETPDSVAGVVFNKSGQMSAGPDRALMDINNLPKPNFSKFPLYRYQHNQTLPIYSSRGCVAKCSFCSETIYWKKYRAVTPENIVQMMETAIADYGINNFYFNDSLMNGSHKLLEEMCDLIIAKGIKVKFEGYSRFDHKLSDSLLEKMSKAGCNLLLFGFESGSQKIIDLMNKKVFVENYEKILQKATSFGIPCQVCIIVGFPGESWSDFFSTLIKVIRVKKYLSGLNLSIMEISRNAPIEKDFAKYGIVNAQNRYWRTKNWTNFYLLRLARYYLFRYSWFLASGKGVSVSTWNSGYLMFITKFIAWFKLKYFSKPKFN
ncbi:MAG: B12-binding domain-containing radical SAM protein [Pseudobdellovibrio sp.]